MNELTQKPTIHLLLVDDDQIDRLACKRALTRSLDCEFVIYEAETGYQGLELARVEKIDCILLDFHLPDLSGVEFLAELAEETGDLPMPVVMLTGSDNAMIAVDALKRGARDYVVKGTDQESLQWLPAVVLRAQREHQTMLDKRVAVGQLREAEAKYRSLVEQIPAITYIASLDNPGQLLYLSPQIEQLGFSAEEWLSDEQGFLNKVYEEDRVIALEAYSQTYQHHTPLRCEYRLQKSTGQLRWFLDEANVVRDETRGALCLQGLLVDITTDKETEQELLYYRRRLEELVAQRTDQLEKQSAILEANNARMDMELSDRKRAEAALRNSENRFRLLLESVGQGIIGLDPDSRCTFVNQTALTLLGYQQEDLMQQDVCAKVIVSVAGVALGQEQQAIHQALRDGIPQSHKVTVQRQDGVELLVECSSHPMQLEGNAIGSVLVFRAVAS